MKENILLPVNTKKLRTDADIENGCVIAVGSFDGVHLGHRVMLNALVAEAKRKGVPAAVFTFDAEDNPKAESKLLALPQKKLELLASLGVDVVLSAAFSVARSLSAADFAEKVLWDSFGAKSVVCGYDFRFGRGRSGDVALIKTLLSPKGVDVITPEAVCVNGVPVSSTTVRALVSQGDVASAGRLLARPFSFSAPVIHGAMLGRGLGFPTINQAVPCSLVLPKFGVYAVKCLLDGKIYSGVANVGVKPTCGDGNKPLCETHLFDFSGDCYGSEAEIYFMEFIREEKRFDSLSELRAQVERDKSTAKEILSKGAFEIQ